MDDGAIVDILQNPRFEGAMSTIQGVTDVVDLGFMSIITFLSFFIISVALLRNVFAGVYCAFPRFWDQVADAHEAQKDTTLANVVAGVKDSYKTASMSTIKQGLMSILPNIKALTDFQDNTQTAKSYFIKAIPQMIMVVVIGVFIYNGYYRDATALVAGTGAELLERTLLSVDPVKAFDTIANTAGRPSFATDNAVSALGKVKNDVTVNIYSEIISTYTDIKTADDKAVLAANIDAAVATLFGTEDGSTPGVRDGLAKMINEDTRWKTVTRVDMGKDFNTANSEDFSGEDRKQYCFKIALGKTPANGAEATIAFDSTVDAYQEDWYIRVRVLCTRIAVQADMDKGLNDATVAVGGSTGIAYTIHKSANPAPFSFTATGIDEGNKDKKITVTATYKQPANGSNDGTYTFTSNADTAGMYKVDSPTLLKGYCESIASSVNILITKVDVSLSNGTASWSASSNAYAVSSTSSFNVNKVEVQQPAAE